VIFVSVCSEMQNEIAKITL